MTDLLMKQIATIIVMSVVTLGFIGVVFAFVLSFAELYQFIRWRLYKMKGGEMNYVEFSFRC
jgi:hypothetical protein